MKKLVKLLISLAMATSLVACSSSSSSSSDSDKEATTTGATIAVVTDVGQLNDGGFNQGTWEGAKEFAEANGLTYQYYQPANGSDATDADRIAAMEQAVENGAEVIVTPGYLQQAAIATVAAEYPEVKFVFVDGWAFGMSNVTAISYKEQESGYLAGYAVVKDGYTKLGGTFGGAGTNAACNRFAYGYVQGANAAAAELGETVDVTVSFKNGGSFSASAELQTQIAGWYANGTQVVFSCGGSMLQSVKSAAEETTDGKIIGVDVDQYSESERVITSAVKGLTASVELVLSEWKAGEWDTKLADQCSNLGASDDATGLPTATTSWRFKNFTVEQYNEVFAKIADGSLTIASDVADNMDSAEAWASLQAACTNVNFVLE